MSSSSTIPSWSAGLARTGGFYQDADWYAKNMPRKMPLVPKMVEELVSSLPPLGEGKVLDLLSGCGTAAVEIKRAYPRCRLSVLERCPYRIQQCKQALASASLSLDKEFQTELDLCGGQDGIPGGPYDVVVATLAVHTLAGHGKQEEEVLREKYRKIFEAIFSVLKPGGHLLVGDHVGTWGLYKQDDGRSWL